MEVLDKLLARCQGLPALPTAVAHPCEAGALEGAVDAAGRGLIQPILVGPPDKILAVAREANLDISGCQIEPVPHSHAAAARAVELVRQGKADLLMKGSLHTDELMAEVMRSETGLRVGKRVSHVFAMSVPSYHKPLFITDAAINIEPTLEDKIAIAQNAIDLLRALGAGQPKVAILAAVETVTSKMSSTLDAAALCKMADRGQITGGLLDGPLAFDNAISASAARTKGIVSLVAGDPDILLCPNMEAGNMIAKQLTFLAHARAAGLVLGAKVPIILTSRADDARSRVASCALAMLAVHGQRGVALQEFAQEVLNLSDEQFQEHQHQQQQWAHDHEQAPSRAAAAADWPPRSPGAHGPGQQGTSPNRRAQQGDFAGA